MERYGQFARCQLPNKPSQEVDTKGKLDTSLGRASISEIWRSSKNKARWVVNIGHSEFSLQKTAASRRTTDAKGACYSRPSCIHMLSHSNRTQSEVSCAEVEDGSSLKASGKRCGGDPVKVILQSHLPDTGPYSRLEIDSLWSGKLMGTSTWDSFSWTYLITPQRLGEENSLIIFPQLFLCQRLTLINSDWSFQ